MRIGLDDRAVTAVAANGERSTIAHEPFELSPSEAVDSFVPRPRLSELMSSFLHDYLSSVPETHFSGGWRAVIEAIPPEHDASADPDASRTSTRCQLAEVIADQWNGGRRQRRDGSRVGLR